MTCLAAARAGRVMEREYLKAKGHDWPKVKPRFESLADGWIKKFDDHVFGAPDTHRDPVPVSPTVDTTGMNYWGSPTSTTSGARPGDITITTGSVTTARTVYIYSGTTGSSSGWTVVKSGNDAT